MLTNMIKNEIVFLYEKVFIYSKKKRKVFTYKNTQKSFNSWFNY